MLIDQTILKCKKFFTTSRRDWNFAPLVVKIGVGEPVLIRLNHADWKAQDTVFSAQTFAWGTCSSLTVDATCQECPVALVQTQG